VSTETADAGAGLDTGRPPWALLTSLWITQYVGIGFLGVGLVAILRDGGASLDTLAVVSLVGLLWPLKMLWAPVVDRYGSRRHGHYRSWLLVLQAAMVVTLLALLLVRDPAVAVGPVLVICAAFVLLSATQDVATDALAVRLLPVGHRGTGNGIQVAATYAGAVLGGGVCVLVHDLVGWSAAVLLLVGLTLVALLQVAAFREPPREQRVGTAAAWAAPVGVYRRPGVPGWALGVVPLLYCGAAGVNALTGPALVDAGWSLARVGFVTGVVVSVPALVAGVVAGRLVRSHGRARVLVVGGIALLASTAGLLPLLTGRVDTVGAGLALSGFLVAYTALNVVVYTVVMDLARPATSGTDFTTLTTVPLVASFVAGSVSLALAERAGYVAPAVLCCAVALGGVALGVRWLRRWSPAGTPGQAGSRTTTAV
jgi:MFS family permease